MNEEEGRAAARRLVINGCIVDLECWHFRLNILYFGVFADYSKIEYMSI